MKTQFVFYMHFSYIAYSFKRYARVVGMEKGYSK
jgi:hypothetical protein